MNRLRAGFFSEEGRRKVEKVKLLVVSARKIRWVIIATSMVTWPHFVVCVENCTKAQDNASTTLHSLVLEKS
jgi:hypothetical protein